MLLLTAARLPVLAVTAILLAGAALPAQNGSGTSVSGTVVNKLTGAPLRRVLVTATFYNPESSQSVLTGESGQFRIERMSAGICGLSAMKPGFRYKPAFDTAREIAKPCAENTKLEMEPLPSVRGKVTDDRGEPWPGVRVEGLQVRMLQGRRTVHRYVGGLTDDRGQFRFYEMLPGLYYFRVAGWGGATQPYVGRAYADGQPYESFSPVYLGGASTLAATTPVELKPGIELRADFELKPAPGYAIRGFVSNMTQYQPARLELLRNGEVLTAAASLNSATGQFQMFLVTDGTYTVRASQGEGAQELRAEAVVRVAGADIRNVLLDLAPPVKVRGSFGNPQTASPPQLGYRLPHSLLFEPLETINPRESSRPLIATPSDDATFEILLFPGRYRVTPKPAGGYPASMTSGDCDLFLEDLVVAPGAGAAPIVVVIRDDGGSLEVAYAAGITPPERSTIVLVPESGHTPIQLYLSAGRFGASNLPPGRYTPYAVSGDDVEWTDPGVLKSEGVPGAPFRIEAGATTRIVMPR